LITDEGILHIKRYMAGEVGTIASSISLGVGTSAETATDTALDFEFERADIVLTSFDFVNNRLVFKAVLDADVAGKAYEIGLWTADADDLAGAYGSKLITGFDSLTEEWTNPTWVTTSNRIGSDSLRHAPAASTTATSTLSELFLDLLGNSGADKFLLAYNNGNANCASIQVRLETDTSNYYAFTITNPATGYNVTELTKGSVTTTGSPMWDNITGVSVITTAKAAGSASVEYDGLRIEDVDTTNPDYVLVAREVITPYTKEEGRSQEIEFYLAVNVSG
jgi:hypothetical protein